MNRTGWEKLITNFKWSYGTDIFLIICAISALVVLIKSKGTDQTKKLFAIYAIGCIILFLSGWIYILMIAKDRYNYVIFVESGNIFFSLIESYVFITYFKKLFISPRLTPLLNFFLTITIIASAFFFFNILFLNTSNSFIRKTSDLISSLSLLYISIICLIYFHRLLTNNSTELLSKKPSFWIVSSLFFYSFMIIPFFLISAKIFRDYPSIYATLFRLHFISLGVVFLAISKAVLLKKPLTI